MKRQRGRNRNGGGKPQHNSNRAFDSNGPDNIKVRGAAQHVYEKYQQLARDAQTAGDRVTSENYLQHAEHYFRVMRAMQPQRPVSDIIGRDQFVSGYDIDFEDESGGVGGESEAVAEGADAERAGADRQGGERSDRGYERGPERGQGERFGSERQGQDRFYSDRRDRERSDRFQSGERWQGADRAQPERQNFDRPHSERPNFERSNSDRQNSDRQNSDRQSFDRQSFDRQGGDRQGADRYQSDRRPPDRDRAERASGERQGGERPQGERAFDRPARPFRDDRQRSGRDDRGGRLPEGERGTTSEPGIEAEGGVLRADDGGINHAPAFLQVRPVEPREEGSGEARRPRRRRPPRGEQDAVAPTGDEQE